MPDRHLPHDWFPEPIPENVFIGERSWLYSSFAFRHFFSHRPVGLHVDHDTGLYNGTFFNLGPEGEVSIGSFCTLVGAIICCNSRVVIHDYAFIAHEVVLADNFAGVPFLSGVLSPTNGRDTDGPRTSIVIGKNVWIGARAILLDGARLGEGSVVGAAAVVDFEVPPFSVVAGNPASVVRQIPRMGRGKP